MVKKMISSVIVLVLALSLLTPALAGPAAVSLPGVTVSAFVKQLTGNTNDLTISISGVYGDYSATFNIRNNAEGTYKLGNPDNGEPLFTVYVDTKGNTQIRECYVVEFLGASKVKLGEGSVGDAASEKIVNLEKGYYYLASVGANNPVSMFVTKDGLLSANPNDLALLTTTEISKLYNGQTYFISKSSSYPLQGVFTPEMLEQIDIINNRWIQQNLTNYTSLSVGVVMNGQAHYFNYGYSQSDLDPGYANPADRTPVNEHTVYEIASLSKPIVGVLLSYFAQQGWVNMTDAVSLYYPMLPDYIDGAGNHIQATLEHLSAHTAGLQRDPISLGNTDRQAMYTALSNPRYLFQPGTDYSYSNFGAAVLGNLLVDVFYELTGDSQFDGASLGARGYAKAYSNLLELIFSNPLGLRSTKVVFDDDADMTARRSLPHRTGRRAGSYTAFNIMAPCGGINSTVHDMTLWMAANCGDYIPEEAADLVAAIPELYVPRHNMDNMGRSFVGLGWNVQPNRPSRLPAPDLFPTGIRYGELAWHTGQLTTGCSTEYMTVRAINAGVVAFTNDGNDPGIFVDPLCAEILDVILSPFTDESNKAYAVVLTPDSVGNPGDRCITNLEPGFRYILEINTTTPYKTISTILYTNANGIVTDVPTQSAPLAAGVTTITHANPAGGIRILNGQTYKVTQIAIP